MRILLTILALASTLCVKAQMVDEPSAMAALQDRETDPIEGIWEFPEDETRVLIIKDKQKKPGYEIIVLDTPDCRLEPGTRLGTVTRSADNTKYELALLTTFRDGVLKDYSKCMAEFKKASDALYIRPRKLTLSVRTLWVLPKFWRMVHVSVKNPQGEIPVGLVKLYPKNEETDVIYL